MVDARSVSVPTIGRIGGLRAYHEKHPGKYRKLASQWGKLNPMRSRIKSVVRDKRVRQATPVWFGEFDLFVLAEATRLSVLRERVTGVSWHVDHVMPIHSPLVCGFHAGCNVAVIPASQNLSKSNRVWPDMPL